MTTDFQHEAVANLLAISDKIRQAPREVQLESSSKTDILIVTKYHPASSVRPLLHHGHRAFAENKVQEALEKWPTLKYDFPETELHMIGPLQTNKVKQAIELFDVIQTIDREKLARKIAQECQQQQKFPRLYIQVNVGDEPQKAGISMQDADAFIALCQNELKLTIEGLMCIPPKDQPAGLYFGLLRKLAQRNAILKLSMGMSDDYTIAAQLGASYVRIGTAIMGPRPAL